METRSKSKNMSLQEVTKILDDRFAKIKDEIVNDISSKIEKSLIDTIKKEVTEAVNNIFKEKEKEIEKMSSTISMLQKQISSLKHANIKQAAETEELEQYGRRQCLRIDGVPVIEGRETEEMVRNKVLSFMENDPENNINLDVPELIVDRAHRIGRILKPRPNKNEPTTQSIIVKFSTFRHRSMFYYERKGLFDKYGIRVRLDMTKSRYNLYKEAIDYVKNIVCVKYVYSDINCRLKVKFTDDTETAFGNMHELENLFED